jgi:natural product biosynthesis luciferase-like monooxygenase protein
VTAAGSARAGGYLPPAFGRDQQAGAAPRYLFCLPYAGGNASLFRDWPDALAGRASVVPLRLPGRLDRLAEPAVPDLGTLVDGIAGELAAALDRPYALFGVSMGALVAFELGRRLTRDGAAPERLFVASYRAPRLPQHRPLLHALPPGDLVGVLRRIGAAPPGLLDSPELMRAMLPTIRADFAVTETYRYSPGPALPAPITVLRGRDDGAATEAQVAGWRDESSRPVEFVVLGGGHFFLAEDAGPLLSVLRDRLPGRAGAAPTTNGGRPAMADITERLGALSERQRELLQQRLRANAPAAGPAGQPADPATGTAGQPADPATGPAGQPADAPAGGPGQAGPPGPGQPAPGQPPGPPPDRPLRWSLFFFAAGDAGDAADQYRLLLDCARFADERGFDAVWLPERHFDRFGAPYPSPSVLAAAVLASTRRLQVRAGSVVLPLHDPIRVAEEWAVLDNLSGGRVGISFASGWHANDFVLAPGAYPERKQVLLDKLAEVRALWARRPVRRTDGAGTQIDVLCYPAPLRPQIPTWITSSVRVDTWLTGARHGMSVLTGLMEQTTAELAEKVAAYHAELQATGRSAADHAVTVMLHTFIGTDPAQVQRTVHDPLVRYLRAHIELFAKLARSTDLKINLDKITDADKDALAALAFEKYFTRHGLFGTPQTALPMVRTLHAAGVTEIACLVDFGVESKVVLEHLEQLDQLRTAALVQPAG